MTLLRSSHDQTALVIRVYETRAHSVKLPQQLRRLGEVNLSAEHTNLPFILSYYQSQRPDGTHVQRYVGEKSDKLLKALGEKPIKDLRWMIHSYGAWLKVQTENNELFDRIVLVLPKPEHYSSKLFTSWAEGRLKYLAEYIERTNSGRIVRYLTQKQVVIAILMARRGFDLQDPQCPLPEAEGIPKLLKLFDREISMYITWMSDEELSFIQALKLHQIPQANRAPIYKLSLDILPTVLGLKGKPIPLQPVTLLRGVIGELAEQLDSRGPDPIDPDARGLSLIAERYRCSLQRRRIEACVRELDALAARIDLTQPSYAQVSNWVSAFNGGKIEPLIPLRLVFAALCLGAATWLLWAQY